MSVSIEQWRGAIGRFRGGRSGTSHKIRLDSNQRQYGSSWCFATAMLLAALILSPLLLVGWSYLPSRPYSHSNFKQSSDVKSPCGPEVQRQENSFWSPSTIELSRLADLSHSEIVDFLGCPGNRSNRGIKLAHWNAGIA